jgi:diguanylate cyclase (GGDEF)-like protein
MSVCVLVALVIAWLDHQTGPYFSFSLFYIVPILAASWWLGATPGVIVAAASGVGWLACELAWPETPNGVHLVWNTLTRFSMFLLLSVVAARMQRDRRALARSNQALRELAAREARLGRTDPLTGLLNVRAFREGLEEEISRARRQDAGLCLAVVDLNGFKAVNDTLGHGAGDELLQKVAGLMRDCVRADDLAARIGGDEFAICFHEADPELAEGLARGLEERLRGVTAAGFPLRGASIGLACFDVPPSGCDAVLTMADQAMFAAKRKAEVGVVVWRDRDLRPIPPNNTDRQPA